MIQNVKVRCECAWIRIANKHGRFLVENSEIREPFIAFRILKSGRQLSEITHRDVISILLAKHTSEAKPDRRVVAHHPFAIKRLTDIQILCKSQA